MSSAVPEGWRINTIDEIARTSAGGTPSTQIAEYWEGGSIPWMSSGEVHKKRVRSVDQCITQLGYDNSSAKLFPPKTLLIALAGQGKTRGTVAISEVELTTNQSIAGVLINDTLVEPDFVFHNLDSRYDELRSVSGGSGRAGLNLTIIGEQEILLPPLSEQQKIASILSSVDDVITRTTVQIDKLKDLKTGMMQELLTKGLGHTEYKDSPVGRIPVGWDVLKMSTVTKVIDSLHQTPKFSDEGLPMIRVSDIKPGKVSVEKALKVKDDVFDQFIKNHKPQRGDLLMSRVGSYGICCYIDRNVDLCLGQNTVVITPIDIDYRFLYYCITSSVVQDQVELEVAGSGYKALSLASIRDLNVVFPGADEQAHIAKVLVSIDSKIEMVVLKRSSLLNAKKALMQDLLTGNVRVSVN